MTGGAGPATLRCRRPGVPMRAFPILLSSLLAAGCDDPSATGSAATQAPPPTLFPTLDTSSFQPGQPFDVVVGGMPRWTRTYLFGSLAGVRTDHGPCAPLDGGCLDLAPRVYTLGFGLADADGEVSFHISTPPAVAREVTFQAGVYHAGQQLSGLSETVTLLLQDEDFDGVATADDCDDLDPTVSVWLTGYVDADGDGVAADGVAYALCTDGTLPAGYVDTPGDDCGDDDPLVLPGATELCDGVVDDNCDGMVDEGCPSNDPFNAGSCLGTPWTEAEAMAYLAGRSRVVLDTAIIQQRSCPGGVCGGASSDWMVHYLTYSGGVSTRYRDILAQVNLVLFDNRGVPALSIQHTSFSSGGYPDTDGMVYGFPPSLITYPHLRAFNTLAGGSDYTDLDYQVRGTSITFGDGCVRWTAEPFGAPTTRDWAVRFTW
ncbi:MAG: putative metal-binding motif-containing protein [Alphaproteobacteria bacterium]|nr:putative metal-binding motif-containing protein [Alphaproteobacteria bacterium]